MYTPAAKLPAETLFVTNARSLSPLVCALVEGVELPQLSHTLTGSSDNKTTNTLFKPGAPTSCGIITWMQEEDYSKGENEGRSGVGARTMWKKRTGLFRDLMRRARTF
jgi:hypothetical protein